MTEKKWKRSKDPLAMLEFLTPDKARTRSLALFAIAACRRDEIIMGDDSSRLAVEWSEKLIEGLAKDEDDDEPTDGDCYLMAAAANRCMIVAGSHTRGDTEQALEYALVVAECLLDDDGTHAPLADLIRDVFGNPFRLVALDPAWRSEAAVGIARGIYEDRAFNRMPILADALQDAGCVNDDILSHCREPGEHVRGCWVVDLVLGKS